MANNEMEDFASMWEQYTSDEEIEEYLDDDDKEYSIHQTDSPFSEEDTITLSKYVNLYLGLDIDCSNLWNSSLDDLLREYGITESIPVASNITNANPDLVYQGYVLIVLDSRKRHNRRDYINPAIIRMILDEEKIKERMEEITNKQMTGFQDVEETFDEYQDLANKLIDIKKYESIIKLVKRKTKINELKEQHNNGGRKI